jgi:hypothetical protein
MDKEKIKKVLKNILIVFVVISAILFWIEIVLVVCGVFNGWFDEPIEVEPGTQAWYLG